MPSSIPYDPSLTLTSVVSEAAIKNVEQIANLQSPVDAAQNSLNSLIASKHSLDMTKFELENLGVPVVSLDAELIKLNSEIDKAAAQYATVKLAAEPQIQKLREAIRSVNTSMESPVDYLKTEVKTMPLAADTMNMDVQYFSFDPRSQNAKTFGSQVASYVSSSTGSVFPPAVANKVGAEASTQVTRQVESHSIEGTLVLSVTCTHKNASILAPFTLRTDKAIETWNSLFPGKRFDTADKRFMVEIAATASPTEEDKFSVISGATYGSSFVGMVHVLNSSTSSPSDTLESTARSMQATMDSGGWFAKASGKVGVDEKFASEVKSMLTKQQFTSHVTLITMGVIPSIVANQVSIAVDKFTGFDPQNNIAHVAAIQNATANAQSTVKSMAEASRTGEQSANLRGKTIASSLNALSVIDGEKNKVLNINSMMTALEDYLKKAAEGKSGVPVNYYLREVRRKTLAEMWLAKYYPDEYTGIKHDEGEDVEAKGSPKAKL